MAKRKWSTAQREAHSLKIRAAWKKKRTARTKTENALARQAKGHQPTTFVEKVVDPTARPSWATPQPSNGNGNSTHRYRLRVYSHQDGNTVRDAYEIGSWGELIDVLTQKYAGMVIEEVICDLK